MNCDHASSLLSPLPQPSLTPLLYTTHTHTHKVDLSSLVRGPSLRLCGRRCWDAHTGCGCEIRGPSKFRLERSDQRRIYKNQDCKRYDVRMRGARGKKTARPVLSRTKTILHLASVPCNHGKHYIRKKKIQSKPVQNTWTRVCGSACVYKREDEGQRTITAEFQTA